MDCHYHDLGLLVPDRIDDTTGCRLYDTGQIPVLQWIVVLKNLGLTLSQVAEVIDPDTTQERVRTILHGRKTNMLTQIADLQHGLDQLDQRIASLNGANLNQEPNMSTSAPDAAPPINVEVRKIPARLVAQLSDVAESWAPEHIGPVIAPLYPELTERVERAGVAVTGPSTTWYSDTDDGRLLVHATLTIGERPSSDADSLGFEVVQLPAIDQAAVAVHRGTMDNSEVTGQALLSWIDDHGYRPVGYHRELDIECGPDRQWIVELQQAIEPIGPNA